MVKSEKRAACSLALIMAFRMLGMFMILPILSVSGLQLHAATPTRIGIALGIYGMTQACLQIPMGSLSDKFGRKKIITFGLALFALGSLLGTFSHSIYGIIAARALQGAGAIGSTILAMAADLTRDENRSKTMAIIGLVIGLSFSAALVLGPAINHWLGLQGIFLTSLALSVLAIILLHTIVPNPPKLLHSANIEYQHGRSRAVLKNPALLRLNLGIFSLHAILTATFIATPILLTHNIQLSQPQQTLLYLAVLMLAFLLMLPLIIIGEKKRQLKPFFLAAIALLILCELMLATHTTTLIHIGLILTLFFTAFTFLEASLPSLVSKISPINRKGTAMGIYSTAQFAGIFAGGSLGGILFTHFQLSGVFIFCSIMAAIWLLAAISMPQPPYLTTCIFPLKVNELGDLEKIKQQLATQAGIAEFAVAADEQLIYIKADQKIIGKHQLIKIMNKGNLA